MVNFDETSLDEVGLCDIDWIATPFAVMQVGREQPKHPSPFNT